MSLNQKIASKSVQIEIKNFECEICRKKFKNKYRVERHRSTVHKNLVESYKCQNCGNLYFNTKKQFEEHNHTLHSVRVQIHTRESVTQMEVPNAPIKHIFQCEICQTAFFVSNQDLEDHIQTVHSNSGENQPNELQTLLQMTPRNDVIDLGEEDLNILDQVLINIGVNDESHRNETKSSDSEIGNAVDRSTLGKRFQCHQCSCSYTRKFELDLHVSQKHRGERYTCHLCGLTFCKRNKLTFHYSTAHKFETKVHCTHCQKVFFSEKILKKHMNANHESLTCNQCNKTFTKFKSLQSHKAAVHEKIKHKCETCGKSYSRTYLLKNHICQKFESDYKTGKRKLTEK